MITNKPKKRSKLLNVLYIPAAVYIFKAMETLYPILKSALQVRGYTFLNELDYISEYTIEKFATPFVEWFGVLYGFLVPLILVRVWEQFDSIDREFDREADTVKILYEDLQLLNEENEQFGRPIIKLLYEYVKHVIAHHPDEANKVSTDRAEGDKILKQIREKYKGLIHSSSETRAESDPLITELIHRLNDIIDIRGDRIGMSDQRLFESLRVVALITSIIFLLPFYFVGFTSHSGLLDNILVFFVTLLVIFIYTILEDLDEPFDGIWKVDKETWSRLRDDIRLSGRDIIGEE
jgi:hypothetical protein